MYMFQQETSASVNGPVPLWRVGRLLKCTCGPTFRLTGGQQSSVERCSVGLHTLLAQQFSHSIYLSGSPGQPTSSDDPGEQRVRVIGHIYWSWCHPSRTFYVLLHCHAGWEWSRMPNNVIHRVLPLPLNLVHSCAYLYGGLTPGTERGMELGQKKWGWGCNSHRVGLLLLFDHLYIRVDGFFLLGLLHTAQTSNEGLVGLVKLLCLLFCLLQLHLGNGAGQHQDTLMQSHTHTQE